MKLVRKQDFAPGTN